jgi:hypothetical protein
MLSNLLGPGSWILQNRGSLHLLVIGCVLGKRQGLERLRASIGVR